MGLNLGGQSGGDFNPYVKYNGKAGRWYTKGENGETEVNPRFFIMDLANIKTGWMLFLEGQAPSQVWDPSLSQPAARPSDAHKRGFQVSIYAPETFGDRVFDLSNSSMHMNNSINELYNQFEDEAANNVGKVPVVEYTGATAMKDKMGTNYKPNFRVVKWVDRPSALSSVAVDKTASVQPVKQPAPPVQGPSSLDDSIPF